MALQTGDPIPSVSLKDKDGADFNLDRFTGSKAVVIYFYPKNFTPGCTTQACNFRDHYQDFQDLNAEVIAISSDSGDSHSRFTEKYNLPFIFLSDKDKVARKAFGVQASLLGLVPGRETFVFDKSGKLKMRYNNLNSSQHTEKALQIVRELQNQ